MKKTLSIILVIVISMLAMPVATYSAYAANYDDLVAPCWDNASMVRNTLTVSGTAGKASSRVIGLSGTTKISISIDVYVQQGSTWVYVGGDSDETNSATFNFTYNFTAVSGGYYRADYTIVVTRNGVDETITETKYK